MILGTTFYTVSYVISSFLPYLLSGLLGVTNMILWGVYGDLLVERFDGTKVFRSIVIGILWSIFLFVIESQLPLFVVALIVISLERITTEIYKALIRHEDQTKYQIPSDLNIKINQNFKRCIGVLLIILIGVLVYAVEIPVANVYLIVIIGFTIALGGMLKDAPYEGFDLIKFFRSPGVAVAVGALLMTLFPSLTGTYFLLAVAGGERIISEFYKKILHGRIPGKFKNVEFNKTWQSKRRRLLPLYILNIAGLIALLVYSA